MHGLRRGFVVLVDHETAWEDNAKETIAFLKAQLGDAVVDAQHIGSTAIRHIKAKPIVDIVVGVKEFSAIRARLSILHGNGIIHRPNNDMPEYMMFVMGDMQNEIRTHHIHVVPYNGEEWCNQLNFRDYMNAHPEAAKEYEALKLKLYEEYSENRAAYTKAKEEYILRANQMAARWKAGSESRDDR